MIKAAHVPPVIAELRPDIITMMFLTILGLAEM